MPSSSKEPLDQVLSNYKFKVLSIRNESYKDKKGVWWIQTPDGLKILKKISNSEATLKHILHAVRHLTDKGINIPSVNKTTSGQDYVNIEGVCYVVSDAVEGRNPSYNIPDQLAAVVKGLAAFHKASEGFKILQESKPKFHLGTWVRDYQEQVSDMNKYYQNEASLGANNEAGSIILKEFPYFFARAQKAIEGLNNSEYTAWVEKANQKGSLCHQDFAAGNLILTSSRKLYVLDTDSITIDIPARDIRKLLNKIMKKHSKWDLDLTKKIFAHYQSVNPLTPEEWRVVKYDLMYPHLFIGAMSKYYYKREKEWTLSNYAKKIQDSAAIEKTIEPLLENFDAIIPV